MTEITEEAQEKGLCSMPPVMPCISSLVVSPDEALKHELCCPGSTPDACYSTSQQYRHGQSSRLLQQDTQLGLSFDLAVATSRAAFCGVPLSEICAAATCTSPCRLTSFYRIDVAPISFISFTVWPENF